MNSLYEIGKEDIPNLGRSFNDEITQYSPNPVVTLNSTDLVILKINEQAEGLITTFEGQPPHLFPQNRLAIIKQTLSSGQNTYVFNDIRRDPDETVSIYEWQIKVNKEGNYNIYGLNLNRANTDPLVGVMNRNFMMTLLPIYDSSRNPVTVWFFDINHLRDANNKFGHSFGDKKILVDSMIAHCCLRKGDPFCRWGGDEFLALTENVDNKEANVILQRLIDIQQIIKTGSWESISADEHPEYITTVNLIYENINLYNLNHPDPRDQIKLDEVCYDKDSLFSGTLRSFLGFAVGFDTRLPNSQGPTLSVMANSADASMYHRKEKEHEDAQIIVPQSIIDERLPQTIGN